MKKYILVCFAIGLMLAFGSIAMAGSAPGTGIQNTLHDLSNTGAGGAAIGQTAETRICVFCHTPHFSAKKSDMGTINYYPLWNHSLSTIATYTPYTNGTDIPNNDSAKLNADLSAGPGSRIVAMSFCEPRSW